jgi:hypothetical protein
MRRDNSVVYVVALLIFFVIAVILGTWISQIVWAWVVPDVFSGAVQHEFLPASLKFWQAFKLSLLIVVFFGVTHTSTNSN